MTVKTGDIGSLALAHFNTEDKARACVTRLQVLTSDASSPDTMTL